MSDEHESPEGEHHPAKLILVVEDDENIGEIIIQSIHLETPYQANCVTDGFKALEFVKSVKPQLFLIDYRLPEMNGLELYDYLQGQAEFKAIPAILMSANAPTSELEKRNVYYLRKPFELEELLQIIEQMVEGS